MRITENDNLKNCIPTGVYVDGFDIHDSLGSIHECVCGDEKITYFDDIVLVSITVTMTKSSFASAKRDTAIVKIYAYQNRSDELERIISEITNPQQLVYRHSTNIASMFNNYIHGHIDCLDDYTVQYYTLDL